MDLLGALMGDNEVVVINVVLGSLAFGFSGHLRGSKCQFLGGLGFECVWGLDGMDHRSPQCLVVLGHGLAGGVLWWWWVACWGGGWRCGVRQHWESALGRD